MAGRRNRIFLGAAFPLLAIAVFTLSFRKNSNPYTERYFDQLSSVENAFTRLSQTIESCNFNAPSGKDSIYQAINECRLKLKSVDVWLRYFDPNGYRLLNGPLPVEWETEVFEKYEKPYYRKGAGLILASLYLEEENASKDSLKMLIAISRHALQGFRADSVTRYLQEPGNFMLANRLHILNLGAIYTTGFECPDRGRMLPELQKMMQEMLASYRVFNQSFAIQFHAEYIEKYTAMLQYVSAFGDNADLFDNFTFVRDFVNPLFAMQAEMIRKNKIISRSYVDYALNKAAKSIFDNGLYKAQNTAGIYSGIKDEKLLAEIWETGRMLFYDPILSGNLARSCASCHKPELCFADTAFATPLHYNGTSHLERNAPSLIHAYLNHLIMADGAHFTLQNQAFAVITNKDEMHADANKLLKNIMSCSDYKKQLKKYAANTPLHPKPSLDHVYSALTLYYSSFDQVQSPFDSMMNGLLQADIQVQHGFNLFMGKAQCGTCHFIPHFNGVKPPYVGSEFEVLGTPADKNYKHLSGDSGRFLKHPAGEMLHAFRTPSLINVSRTAPYMHNGVFRNLKEVMEFYNGGGGAGHQLQTDNQTLSSDSLHLSDAEIDAIISFMGSLNENIKIPSVPKQLPVSDNKKLNTRIPRGKY